MPINQPPAPRLSVIVPVLNEREELPGFFADLARQSDIDYELLICDGGSSDGSLEWLGQQQDIWPALRIIRSPAGRARQLNRGIAHARGHWLLLLHVDSRFNDPSALSDALDYMVDLPSIHVAGHFALTFRRRDNRSHAAYYYYEWKARLGFEETIHGDQGFLFHRDLIGEIGFFDESLTVMEDTDFADRLRTVAQWHLLPQEISTSARRFEVEGLWQRQLLGALIMCFRVIGWTAFFEAAPQVYRQQSKTGALRLQPFFELIRKLMRQRSLSERWLLWSASGCYVRGHAWQLFFAVDARSAFRSGVPVGQGQTKWLDGLLPVYHLATDNFVGRFCATLLLRLWFEIASIFLAWREKS